MAPQNQIRSTNHYRRELGRTYSLGEALYPLIYGSSSKIQRYTQAGMGDYELTGIKNKGRTAVDFDHGCELLSPEDLEKMELILTECLDST
jgi:hypothetical protein